jgi:hypothetical protein
VIERAGFALLVDPVYGNVSPEPPPELAMVSVDPFGVMVTLEPATRLRLSWSPLRLLTSCPAATLPA